MVFMICLEINDFDILIEFSTVIGWLFPQLVLSPFLKTGVHSLIFHMFGLSSSYFFLFFGLPPIISYFFMKFLVFLIFSGFY